MALPLSLSSSTHDPTFHRNPDLYYNQHMPHRFLRARNNSCNGWGVSTSPLHTWILTDCHTSKINRIQEFLPLVLHSTPNGWLMHTDYLIRHSFATFVTTWEFRTDTKIILPSAIHMYICTHGRKCFHSQSERRYCWSCTNLLQEEYI